MPHPHRPTLRLLTLGVILLAISALAALAEDPASQPATTTTARASATQTAAVTDSKARLAEAIKFLEAKDYAGLIRNFMSPPDRARLEKSIGSIDEVIKQFTADGRPAEVLARLQLAAKSDPLINTAGTLTTFKGVEDPDHPTFIHDLSFIKIDGSWYIEDK